MIVDKVWKSTNTVRGGLDARSSHAQRQSTFPDNVCSYCPPCHVVSHYENLTTFLFIWNLFFNPQESALAPSLGARAEWLSCASAKVALIVHLNTSAYVSIRQHTSAYVSIRQHTWLSYASAKVAIDNTPAPACRLPARLACSTSFHSCSSSSSASYEDTYSSSISTHSRDSDAQPAFTYEAWSSSMRTHIAVV
jgi:hypothetical protein